MECCRRKTRHTTHLEGFPSEVTIVRRAHPFEGRRLRLFGWMRRRGQLDLILILPDGSKSLIPAAWTDLEAAAASSREPELLGSVRDLLHARTVVDGLLHRLNAEKPDHAGQSAEEVKDAATRSRPRGRAGVADMPLGGASRRAASGGAGSTGSSTRQGHMPAGGQR